MSLFCFAPCTFPFCTTSRPIPSDAACGWYGGARRAADPVDVVVGLAQESILIACANVEGQDRTPRLQTEIYPAQIPPAPNWIICLDPWVQDFYPVLGWGFGTLTWRAQLLPTPALDKSRSPTSWAILLCSQESCHPWHRGDNSDTEAGFATWGHPLAQESALQASCLA